MGGRNGKLGKKYVSGLTKFGNFGTNTTENIFSQRGEDDGEKK